MSIRPILFNGEMVRAILDGRKTQTRRVVKSLDGLSVYRAEPSEDAYEALGKWDFFYGWSEGGAMFDACVSVKAPCSIGDILWVGETWNGDWCDHYIYKADGGSAVSAGYDKEPRWRPSIQMPREAARIFLRVTDVRAERLQDMDEDAAIAEGFVDSPAGTDSPLWRFCELWDKTIRREELREVGYHANPWVWVIEFERCEKPDVWGEYVRLKRYERYKTWKSV